MLALFQPIVSLPDPVKGFIFAGVSFVVIFLLNQIALAWPWLAAYLGPYKDQVIAIVSAALTDWLVAQLNAFPAYEPVINAALAFLSVLIVFFGLPFLTHKFLQRRGFKRFA